MQGNVYRCNGTGVERTLFQECAPSNSHCEMIGSQAYCRWNTCTPGVTGCNGNLLATCKADGGGWESGGTDCSASGKVCAEGQCLQQVCTPGAPFCSENHQRYCQFDGLNSYDYGACPSNTYCAVEGGQTTCRRLPCNSGQTACLSEKLGTCASDGASLKTVTSDCGSQGKLCTLQGCATQAVDSLGAGDQLETPSNTLFGNEISVQASRTISQIEAYLTLPASRALTWMIFEKQGQNAGSSLVYSAATVGTGTGFQSSGSISYGLQAGKTYFIGVNVVGSYGAYFSAPIEQRLLTFGVTNGASSTYYQSSSVYYSLSTDRLYYFRLSTTP